MGGKTGCSTSSQLVSVISNCGENIKNVLVGYNRRFYDFVPDLTALRTKELLSIDLVSPEATNRLVRRYSKAISDYIVIYLNSPWIDFL